MGWFFRALRYWQCFSAHFFLQVRESHGLLSSLPLTMLPAIWSLDQDRDRAARFITCREGEIVREDSEEREREGGGERDCWEIGIKEEWVRVERVNWPTNGITPIIQQGCDVTWPKPILSFALCLSFRFSVEDRRVKFF